MPDKRRHRGPHPDDPRLFATGQLDRLAAAVHDLAWLLSRGYAPESALALVGNRYDLVKRQRQAILRSTCAPRAAERRALRRLGPADVRGKRVAVDAFNGLIGIETALSGGVLFRGMDGALRDLSSVHGTYRRVEESDRASTLMIAALERAAPASAVWYLDRPVSNSGRVAARLREHLLASTLAGAVELVANADRAVVSDADAVAASADSWVIEHAPRGWIDLGGWVVASDVPDAWVVDLRAGSSVHGPARGGDR